MNIIKQHTLPHNYSNRKGMIQNMLRNIMSHITRSGAYPNRVNAENVTHYFELAIPEQPFQQLLIQIPDSILVTEIKVVDCEFNPINCTSTITPINITVDFDQLPKSRDLHIILMKGISSLCQSPRTWIYSVYGISVNALIIRKLGCAKIRMYK